MTTTLENLSTDTTNDMNTFNNLTKKIYDQYSQIITLTKELLAATEAAAKIKTELETIKHYNVNIRQGSGG